MASSNLFFIFALFTNLSEKRLLMTRIYKIHCLLQLQPGCKYLLIFLFLITSVQGSAQNDSLWLRQVSDSILKDGIEIHECISAFQQTSDFVIEKLSVEDIIGSITYKKANAIHSVFLNGSKKNPGIRYSFSFSAPFNPDACTLDGEPRQLSDYEKALDKMRKKILTLARKRKSFFTNYDGIVLNPVFVQREDFTWVYLLSSTHDSSFIPFGNDYLLIFNEKSKLVAKEKIHQNLIEVTSKGSDTLQADEAMASYHTHAVPTSPFISSTDISTLLLNKNKVNWESHIVVSDEYVSFFFPASKTLEIITREDYEKMSEEENKE